MLAAAINTAGRNQEGATESVAEAAAIDTTLARENLAWESLKRANAGGGKGKMQDDITPGRT